MHFNPSLAFCQSFLNTKIIFLPFIAHTFQHILFGWDEERSKISAEFTAVPQKKKISKNV